MYTEYIVVLLQWLSHKKIVKIADLLCALYASNISLFTTHIRTFYSATHITECADGDIRRLEDPDGLIEICVSNTWARLCAESLEQSEAEVACQQLGFSAESKLNCYEKNL